MQFIISLGTNIPDRIKRMINARDAIGGLSHCNSVVASEIYETEPVDVLPMHADKMFLNAALLVDCDLTPQDFHDAMHAIELQQGRKRLPQDRNAPRAIDIDIIAAGDITLDTPKLQLPHPRWHERRFVVAPMNDICPDRRLPGSSSTVAEILAAMPASPVVERFATKW